MTAMPVEHLVTAASSVMEPGTRTRISLILRDGRPRTVDEIGFELGITDRERRKNVAKVVLRMLRAGQLERLGTVGPRRAYLYQMPLNEQLDVRVKIQRAAAVQAARALQANQPIRRGPLPAAAPAVVLDHLAHLRRRGLADGTIAQRRGFLRRLSAWLDEQGIDLLEVPGDVLVAWTDFFEGLNNRRNAVNHLSGFYRWAHESAGLIETNPAKILVRPRMPQRFARPIDTTRLRHAIAAADEPVRAWMMIAAYCGLRANEIAHVQREDILTDDETPVLIVTHGKGGTQRAVPVPPAVIEALAPYASTGWLFPRTDPPAGPVSGHLISEHCNDHLHDLGYPDTLHSLRHWYGTMVYRHSDHDLRLCQELLGHLEPRVTAQYAQCSPGAGARVASMLPGLT